MPKFESAKLDYELPGKSANVVNTPKGKALQRPPELKSEPGTERKKDLVRLETRNTEGKRPEESPRECSVGEYKGSVRSLRTQQRA
ncbi:hypothetical protein, partial [Streptomyces alboflavus]